MKRAAARKSARRTVTEASAPSAASQLRAYFAALPPDARKRLQLMRETIRAAAPDAVEAFSYSIPAFRLDGKMLVWYAAWKAHTSLYPITTAIRHVHATELEGYETAKGTVRFPLAEPLPAALLKRLVKARVAEVRAEAPKRARRAAATK